MNANINMEKYADSNLNEFVPELCNVYGTKREQKNLNMIQDWYKKLCRYGGMNHIGHVDRMSVSGYRGRRFEPRHQCVVSLSKTLYAQCFSRSEISTRWGHPREGCSLL